MERKGFLSAALALATGVFFSKKSNATYNPAWGGGSGLLLQNKASGKKMIVFGDSISLTARWPNYLSALNLQSATSYAVSSATFKEWETSDRWASTQIQTAITAGATPDIIVVSLGTNDQENGLGTYAAAKAKTTLNSLDKQNTHEAIRWCLWTITTQWPNAKVFVCTPLQRGDLDMTALTGLRSAIKDWANYYNAIVIDQTFESGICAQYEVAGGSGRYLSDGLHPNTTGQQKQGAFISNQILSAFM